MIETLNTSVYDKVCADITAILNDVIPEIDIVVTKESPSTAKYPLVIIREANNSITSVTTTYDQVTSAMSFEFDVYTETIKSKMISALEASNIISQAIERYMFSSKMLRTSKTPFEYAEALGTIRRVVIRYQGRYFNNKNSFY